MRLNEYQTKQLFARYGITVPRGRVASSSREVGQITEELGGQVVIKAQVLVHGRGRLGGIRIARSTQEAEQQAMRILGMQLGSQPVHKVLVDELIPFTHQYFLSLDMDTASAQPRLTISTIVNLSESNGHGLRQSDTMEMLIDPLFGISEFQVRDVAIHIDLPRSHWAQFRQTLIGLWMVFWECDAIRVEINPLVISDNDGLIVLDGEVELDDMALFRHLELAEMRDYHSESYIEGEARKYGFSYVQLDGNIGTISNGAGLAMSTVDTILHLGGQPANYLDTGPCRSPEKAALAIQLTLKDPNVDLLFVNIFGGISNCFQVAQGIVQVVEQKGFHTPIVMRVNGEGAQEAQLLLSNTPVEVFTDLTDAIQRVIALSQSTPQENMRYEHIDLG
ncbi:MAG: acetate--CoA ligase family protein [Anaerolineae bacterium]|nr:acetate--CoA ligase family protein [Anaerolineae bacterium]